MSVTATSLKLPKRLKSRLERLARRRGESPHAFMLRALESQVDAAERYQSFLDDAQRADEAMRRSGLGYEAREVHAYIEAKALGRRAKRPKAVRWRE